MNEKTLKKRLDFQEKVILKKSEEIESLKIQNEKLNLELQEKEELINSITALRTELSQELTKVKQSKKEYIKLINEVKKMKEILNQNVYKGRWKLIRFLMK